MSKFLITCIVGSAISLPGVALAQSVIYKPVIYEGNGNAYMLVDYSYNPEGEYQTYTAYQAKTASAWAESSTYEGVPGRLAIINSKELDSFVRTTFRPSAQTWIGLRYTCSTKTWTYSSGEVVPVNAYTHWHPTKWGANVRGNTLDCGHLYSYFQAFLGSDKLAPYWALNTNIKGYAQAIIEYPLSEAEVAEEAVDEPVTDSEDAPSEPNEEKQPQKIDKQP